MAKTKKSKSSKSMRKAVNRVKAVKRVKSRIVARKLVKRVKAPKRAVKKVVRKIKLKKAARAPKVKKAFKTIKRVTPSAQELRLTEARREVQTQITKLEAKVSRGVSEEANLLVTFNPNKTASAKAEIEQLLKEVNEHGRIEDTGVGGVFQVTVSNPKELVRKLNNLCKISPEKFNRTFHWTPVDRWCSSNIDTMANAVRELSNNIDNSERWKILIEKRNCDMHERDLVIKLTEKIDKPNVDLKNPDKIIKVDILGDRAGISLLKSDELFNVLHFKK